MSTTITYRCTNCMGTSTQAIDDATTQLTCPHCSTELRTNANALCHGELVTCAVCPSHELYIRKDFPQRLGVSIVVFGLGLSCVTWMFHMLIATFAIFFATALIDFMLFRLVGDLIECYRCHAQYRGMTNTESVHGFDLEIHERHRQLEARKAQIRHTVQ
jgi:DNA-directed RNA polymerase subunit RPC12/RpoP